VEKHDVVLVINLVMAESMSLDQFQGRKDNPFEPALSTCTNTLICKDICKIERFLSPCFHHEGKVALHVPDEV
jgi:hypothetical protein